MVKKKTGRRGDEDIFNGNVHSQGNVLKSKDITMLNMFIIM